MHVPSRSQRFGRTPANRGHTPRSDADEFRSAHAQASQTQRSRGIIKITSLPSCYFKMLQAFDAHRGHQAFRAMQTSSTRSNKHLNWHGSERGSQGGRPRVQSGRQRLRFHSTNGVRGRDRR